jgi:hypothetical protein
MSEVKVNKISPRTNCGTVQLGDSGDTITIPAGATITNNGTQTGFGRTGTVDWQTSIKTTSFTAASGEGYFVNTTSGAITVTLPASPSVGDIVSVKDYAQTFDTNNCTIGRNSQPIEGQTFDLVLSTEGIALTLIYGDATKGWQSVNSNEVVNAAKFITATGGNSVITCGNFKTHVFTGPGTFCVSCAGNSAGSTSVEYLVIAGGGSGGKGRTCGYGSGGGGAGGFRTYTDLTPASPLNGPAKLPVSVQGYPITVGAGGAGIAASPSAACGTGNRGASSTFSTITSTGGGGGIRQGDPNAATRSPGGSGGGAFGNSSPIGSGNTPPVTPIQGRDGGSAPGSPYTAGGGGGAGTTGFAGGSNGPQPCGGNGGTGDFVPTTFMGPGAPSYGEPGPAGRYFAAGGGGGQYNGTSPPVGSSAGGLGGGGNGAGNGGPTNQGITSGSGNTGSGGGGGGGSSSSNAGTSGSGGSGIVMIRYKFQ